MTRLAIPFNGHTEVDLSNPSPGSIAKARSEAQAGKIFSAVLIILSDCVTVDGKPIEDIKKIPWRSAEALMKEIFTSASNLARYFEGTSVCRFCETQNIHKKKDAEDDRIDLTTIVTKYSDDLDRTIKIEVPKDPELRRKLVGEKYANESDEDYKLRLETLKVISRPDGKLKILTMTFRDHTLEDMIMISKKAKDNFEFNNKLYFEILIDADFAWDGKDEREFETVQDIKNKFRNTEQDLFALNSIYYYDSIYAELTAVGLQATRLICQGCRTDYEFDVPFPNFFASALRPKTSGSISGKGRG
ncbi:hypothetical protein [Leptospira andrefontaineae]|uniref:Uncharacterized protein n=1 Tax=Leptospira andrefontaineae TaxID=2484976 RepID=A0A4R9GX33_9LEPT|nr:hypothetical protein [Leptospira andrefontaineae]TGK36281.1 hypothetical protein EHO65_18445 [Leptospira andrefontaineae]